MVTKVASSVERKVTSPETARVVVEGVVVVARAASNVEKRDTCHEIAPMGIRKRVASH